MRIADANVGNQRKIRILLGILVPPGEAGGFAATILRLLGDPPAVRAIGEEGRRRVIGRFTVERMMEEIKALYAALLAHSPSRS